MWASLQGGTKHGRFSQISKQENPRKNLSKMEVTVFDNLILEMTSLRLGLVYTQGEEMEQGVTTMKQKSLRTILGAV